MLTRSLLALAALVLTFASTPAIAQVGGSGAGSTDQDGTPAADLGTSQSAALSEADVAALVAPSVVQVLAGDKEGSGVAIGRGIITNEHVIDGCEPGPDRHGRRADLRCIRRA